MIDEEGRVPVARPAPVARPILEELAARWSPRAIAPDRPVPHSAVLTVLEAARWAPSSGNAQPWRYVLYDEEVSQERDLARATLKGGNAWARVAPVLLLSTVAKNWPGSDEPNPMALHDVGAASMALSLQAFAEGLVVHQLAGFDREAMRRVAQLPAGIDPVTLVALGYPGEIGDLPDKLQQRERGERARRPIGELAWRGTIDGPPVT